MTTNRRSGDRATRSGLDNHHGSRGDTSSAVTLTKGADVVSLRHDTQGDCRTRADIEAQAIKEIVGNRQLGSILQQASSEVAAPAPQYTDPETKRDADWVRDVLTRDLEVTIDDADEYINDRNKLEALLSEDGAVLSKSYVDGFIEGLKRLRKPAPPDNAPPAASAQGKAFTAASARATANILEISSAR